jgi:hypothetical protein
MTKGGRSLRHRIQFTAHLLTAAAIILEGVSKCEHFLENWPFVAVLFASGMAVLVITVGHNRIARRFQHTQPVLYVLEAVASVAIGIIYIREGKVAVQYPCFAASYCFAALAGYSLGRTGKPVEPESCNEEKRA